MIDLGKLSGKYSDVQAVPGAGSVYKAVHVELGRPVMIKVLPRLSLEGTGAHESLFRRGAKAAAGLQHQHIIQVLDYETTLAANILIQEYVEGEALDCLLKRQGQLPLPQVFQIAYQLTQALAAAHAAGRIHRNLKPTEIWLTSQGHVKLGGFEAALLPDQFADPWRTEPLLGNVLYVSPEQVQNQPVTERSDVYALGVLIYLMLTGQPPIGGTHSQAVLYQKVKNDPLPPSRLRNDLPREVDALVLTMLSRNPEDRFANMEEVRQALAPFFAPPPKPSGNLQEAIALRYPFPIALPYALVWQDLESINRFNHLLDTFEATLKYCAALALLSAAPEAADQLASIRTTLSRPSLGHWADYLGTAIRVARIPSRLLQQVRACYLGEGSSQRRCLDIIDTCVRARNTFKGHGATRSSAEYQAAFEELLSPVQDLLSQLDFLSDYPLARTEGLSYARNKFTVKYRSCMGTSPVFRLAEAVVEKPIENGRLGVMDPKEGAFIDLAPLLSYKACPTCGNEEFFYYNGMQGEKKLTFLSYQKGHGFDEEISTNPFAERGMGW